MARAVVLALACAALAADARYQEYSAPKVADYGVAADYEGPRDVHPSEDYRDPGSDTSASLDYDESPRRPEKLATKDISLTEEEDTDWQKRERKARRKSSNDDGNLETLDKYSPLEMVPKFHPSERLSVRPSNVKLRKPDREAKIPHVRGSKFKARKDEFQDDFESEDSLGLIDDYSYDKKNKFENRATTTRAKKVRRKPRDRYVKSRDDDEVKEAEGEPHDTLEAEISKSNYPDYFAAMDRKVMDPPQRKKFDPAELDEIKMPKIFPDSADVRQFYPVNIDKKNPSDFLRDTDSDLEKPKPQQQFDYPEKKLDPELRHKLLGGDTRRFGGMSNDGRRKDQGYPNLRISDDELDKRENFKPKSLAGYGDEDYYDMKRAQNIKNKLPSLMRRTTRASTRATQRWESSRDFPTDWRNRRVFVPEPVKEEKTSSSTLSTTTSTTSKTTTTTTTTTEASTTLTKEELSLAEKSRLSILKKALRKETSNKITTTLKPPVLMQLAANMQTLAIVEPVSREPVFRARDFFEDNPSQLDKVKRLMRHKLVANAKDIKDLTENWDDMVCDYIDTSLLNSANSKSVPFIVMLPFLLIIL